jgi:molecular chaperone DnaK (HSP70)
MMVGIDLGTTNSALAYVDPTEAERTDFPPIRLLEIPQRVEEGRVETRSLLPSFLYLGEERTVGVYAREQSALVPTKVVTSAKSWLSNPDVDRTAKILPWEARDSERSVSPVEASVELWPIFGEPGIARTLVPFPNSGSCSPCRPPLTKRPGS